MVHFYTEQSYRLNEIKLLCDSTWVKKLPKAGTLQFGNGAKSPGLVTCQKCLCELLMIEEERLLKTQKRILQIKRKIQNKGQEKK